MSKKRVRFVMQWERRWNAGEGVVNVSELCREFGISRECGHKWIRRYRESGHQLASLHERSRRPQTSPMVTSDAVQDVIVAARKEKPKWGPIKLRGWLMDRHPGVAFRVQAPLPRSSSGGACASDQEAKQGWTDRWRHF